MLEAVFAGLLAGYAIAIPVGAIAVLIIHTALTHGLRTGMAAAAGAATADLVYASLAALAGLWVTAIIGPAHRAAARCGRCGADRLRNSRPGCIAIGARVDRANGRAATVVYFTALTVGLPFLGGIGERLVFAVAAGAASLSWQLLLAVFGAALGRGGGYRVRRVTAGVGNGVIIVMGALILLGPLAGG